MPLPRPPFPPLSVLSVQEMSGTVWGPMGPRHYGTRLHQCQCVAQLASQIQHTAALIPRGAARGTCLTM